MASYPWAWGLHWSVASVPTDRHSIGEADFPLARRYQLQLASWLWVELHIHFFCFAGNFVSLNLDRFWVCCHSPYVFIYESVPLYLGDVITLELSADSDSCNLSTLSSTKIPEPWIEGRNKDNTFGKDFSKVSYSLHIVQAWVSVLITIYSRKKLCFWWLKVLFYVWNNMSFWVILLRWSFRVVEVVFP